MATILYGRCSTSEQTIEHQQTQAEQAGFKFDHVVFDHGVSGVSTVLAERPQGRRLFDMLRADDVLVVRWLDRLGRNYADITDTLREFLRRGVIVRTVINNMTFDGATKDPMQCAVRDALIGFMAATAQAQAEATKEAQRAGIAHVQANGDENGHDAYLGRKPSYDRAKFKMVRDMLSKGVSISEIARETKLSKQAVARIRDNPSRAEATLTAWETRGKV
jgi:DNA invertase Pin-like site-specific DNA recombinase